MLYGVDREDRTPSSSSAAAAAAAAATAAAEAAAAVARISSDFKGDEMIIADSDEDSGNESAESEKMALEYALLKRKLSEDGARAEDGEREEVDEKEEEVDWGLLGVSRQESTKKTANVRKSLCANNSSNYTFDNINCNNGNNDNGNILKRRLRTCEPAGGGKDAVLKSDEGPPRKKVRRQSTAAFSKGLKHCNIDIYSI